MSKIAINTNNAPSAIGTYSQAIVSGELVFISGQIPFDPQNNTKVKGDRAAQDLASGSDAEVGLSQLLW